MAVQRDVTAFCLRDLEQVGAHSGQADRLSRSCTLVGGGHLLQIKVVDAKENSRSRQKCKKTSHKKSVASIAAARKYNAQGRALGNNGPFFGSEPRPLC